MSGADLTQKSIEDSAKTDLIDTITKNNFFNTKATYVTEKKMKIILRYHPLLQLQ